MRKSLMALVMSLVCSPCLAENRYLWDVKNVVDGDTVKFKVHFLPKDLKPEISVRVKGVDTPEKGYRAKCKEEADLAERASDFTNLKIYNAKSVIVSLYGWDKYGGRVLGEIFIDDKPLSKMLVESGYAREYDGGTKTSWCGN